MRYLLSVILLIFLCVMSTAQEKRALLIGIGDYPKELGWNTIHGQNDIEIICKTLNKQGFQNENITVLIDSEATYNNIIASFQLLLDVSNRNDIIYIQFSGHGQRITDQDGDEEDGFDESWVSYDAHKSYKKDIYVGDKHVTDDYLYDFLTKLRSKVGHNGKIIVIADACHSGSGSRAYEDDEVFRRGSTEKFIIPTPSINVIRKEKPVDWLFVAACKSYQTNFEYKDEQGEYYGALSYCISKSQDYLTNINYTDAIEKWNNIMSEITVYPQDIDEEGRPSKKNSNLF